MSGLLGIGSGVPSPSNGYCDETTDEGFDGGEQFNDWGDCRGKCWRVLYSRRCESIHRCACGNGRVDWRNRRHANNDAIEKHYSAARVHRRLGIDRIANARQRIWNSILKGRVGEWIVSLYRMKKL